MGRGCENRPASSLPSLGSFERAVRGSLLAKDILVRLRAVGAGRWVGTESAGTGEG